MQDDQGIEAQMGAVRDDVARLREDLQGLVQALSGSAEGEVGKLFSRVGGLAGDKLGHAVSRLRDTETSITKAVASRPLLCLVAAFAAGLLFGRILNR